MLGEPGFSVGLCAMSVAGARGVITQLPDGGGVSSRRPHRGGVQPDSLTLAMRVRPSETITMQFSARKPAF